MNCNILVMGLTGVGKSSLINYLAGEELSEAGLASGSGGLTRGIHTYPMLINGQNCMVSDSEGLEASHSAFWQQMMEKELLKVDVNKPISQWYHIVVYCIGANGGRVQDIEIDMLKKLNEAGYGVIVAFTKADLASDEDLSNMQAAIEDSFEYYPDFYFIPVCSKKTRSSQLEGKEALSNAIIDAWGDSMINRIPKMVYDPIIDAFPQWVEDTINWIDNQEIGLGLFRQSKDDVLKALNTKVRDKVNSMAKSIKKRKDNAFNEISQVYSMLNVVLDTKALSAIDPKFNNKIERLESSFVFDSNTERNSWLAVGGGGLLLAAPYLAPFIGVGALILNAWDRDNQREEMVDAFINQATKINRSFCEQKYALRYSIAAMLGYMSGYRELGICYLKGRGTEQNYDKFIDCLNEIINYHEENSEYQDNVAEYYIGYAFAMSEDSNNANYWFQQSANHGNERARMILNGKNMKHVESLNDKDYEKEWK